MHGQQFARPTIQRFACEMEYRMRATLDQKNGYRTYRTVPADKLMAELLGWVEGLRDSISVYPDAASIHTVQIEAAMVACYCMMLADKAFSNDVDSQFYGEGESE